MKKVFAVIIVIGLILTAMSQIGFHVLSTTEGVSNATEYTEHFNATLAIADGKNVIVSDGDYFGLFCVQHHLLLLIVGVMMLLGGMAALVIYSLRTRSENAKPIIAAIMDRLTTYFVIVCSLRWVALIVALVMLSLSIWGMVTVATNPETDFEALQTATELVELIDSKSLTFGEHFALSCVFNRHFLMICALLLLTVSVTLIVLSIKYAKLIKGKNANTIRANSVIYLLLVLMSIIWLAPFFFLVLQSFRSYVIEHGGMVNYIAPKHFSFDNYRFLFAGASFSSKLLVKDPGAIVFTVLTHLVGIAAIVGCLIRKPKNPLETSKGNFKAAALILLGMLALDFVRCIDSTHCEFVRWFINTLTIAGFCAVIQTIMQLSVSYTLSRMRFKGRKMLMNVCLVLGMFPGFLTMIVLYYLLKMLGLTEANAVPGLILISCASSGMGYYISKGFFDTIPKSLDESARIDGATRFQVFLKIIMPMAKPIVIYTILMAFMGPWGDYVFASYVAFKTPSSYNVAVGLYQWVNTNDYQGYFTRFCAGGVLVAIPITVLFMCLQKYYVEGVTGGAVKG